MSCWRCIGRTVLIANRATCSAFSALALTIVNFGFYSTICIIYRISNPFVIRVYHISRFCTLAIQFAPVNVTLIVDLKLLVNFVIVNAIQTHSTINQRSACWTKSLEVENIVQFAMTTCAVERSLR